MESFSPADWQKAREEARAREERERDTRHLLTMATMRHRGLHVSEIYFENRNFGVPPGRLHFYIDVDSKVFYETLRELEKRKSWK